jgi:hypothetical protein
MGASEKLSNAESTGKSQLDSIPPQTVEPLTHDIASLRRAADAASMRFHHVKLSPELTKNDLLDAIAKELEFPSYFGRNLDALHDSLTESKKARLIVLDGIASNPEGAAILTAFRDAAKYYASRAIGFRVLYS